MHIALEKCPNRRQFINGGLALAAGIAMLGPDRILADNRDEYARWAFLSDTHPPVPTIATTVSTPVATCRKSPDELPMIHRKE